MCLVYLRSSKEDTVAEEEPCSGSVWESGRVGDEVREAAGKRCGGRRCLIMLL